MAPTPKRKHSPRRTGKRRASKKTSLPQIVYDKKTGKPRLAHRNNVQITVKQQDTLVKTDTKAKKAASASEKQDSTVKETPQKEAKPVK